MDKTFSSASTKSAQSNSDFSIHENSKSSFSPQLKEKKRKSKKTLQSQKSFKYRNLIKKMKTHCIKVLEKLIKSCLVFPSSFSLYNLKSKSGRLLFRYFKSDISKNKNKILMNTTINFLLERFLGSKNFAHLLIKEEMKHLYNYLINIQWRQFIFFVKYHSFDLVNPYFNETSNLLNRNNINILLNYISSEQDNTIFFDKRTINTEYLTFIKEISPIVQNNKLINNDVINGNFKNFLCSFKSFN